MSNGSIDHQTSQQSHRSLLLASLGLGREHGGLFGARRFIRRDGGLGFLESATMIRRWENDGERRVRDGIGVRARRCRVTRVFSFQSELEARVRQTAATQQRSG